MVSEVFHAARRGIISSRAAAIGDPLGGLPMLYIPATHPKIAVGQRWRCVLPSGATAVIVAIDSAPNGLVVNVVIEDHAHGDNVNPVLAPVDWAQLEPQLSELVADNVDVSEHVASYESWKEQAQTGEAGFWRCSLEKILDTVRH